ncbi:hypothetical protein [Achromobacter phage Motura]|uniref:Uncharacterized protein n=1 Tax=Achromobacter phage Motura TaxID=2591403 RepID=A0A514CSR2_9CAUD|nr:hypothetical protein H1O15_gp302 [Achromobacter phage Motura]QDH83504.1 hypothetical protein [Achromobacter phage Motura]
MLVTPTERLNHYSKVAVALQDASDALGKAIAMCSDSCGDSIHGTDWGTYRKMVTTKLRVEELHRKYRERAERALKKQHQQGK